jgi:hypothetical protein
MARRRIGVAWSLWWLKQCEPWSWARVGAQMWWIGETDAAGLCGRNMLCAMRRWRPWPQLIIGHWPE